MSDAAAVSVFAPPAPAFPPATGNRPRVGRPPIPGRPACRACRVRNACRPRGLCCGCHRNPDVRARFPVAECRYTLRGHGLGNPSRSLPVPAEPTSARPGSAEKVEILARRAAAGHALWHPDDGRDPC